MRLTHDPEEDLVPAWSPDGSRIAFQSNRTANNEIYLMNADGSDMVNLTNAPNSGGFDPAWSPDGNGIVFVSDRDGGPDIYMMDADGSGVTRLTEGPSHDWSPAWSTDGTKISFESDGDGRVGIYVMNADGTDLHKLIDTAGQACCPAWQPVPRVAHTPTPPAISAEVAGRVRLEALPGPVAAAEGSVWVATYDFEHGQGAVVRINPATNQVLATVPVDGIAYNLAAGAGAVWVPVNARRGPRREQTASRPAPP